VNAQRRGQTLKKINSRIFLAALKPSQIGAVDPGVVSEPFGCVVTPKMDRLARSPQHLLEIVEGPEKRGVALRILDSREIAWTPTAPRAS
jgi:hypothetical protein